MTTDAEIRNRDAEARIRAQREFQAPLVMQAGAGTGKTAALTARVVAWSLGEGWDRAEGRVARGEGILPPNRAAASAPSSAEAERLEAEAQRELVARDVLGRIAAITFTEAAAAEMAERIEDALSEVESGSVAVWMDEASLPPVELRAERARALREALDHLTVRTIHAWCRSLLARFPLAAKLPPDFEVDASGRVQAEAMQWVLTEQLREEYSRDEGGPLLDLAADECGPTAVYDAAITLVGEGVRSQELEGDPLPVEGVRELLGAFHSDSERLSACEPPALKGAAAAAEVFELLADSRALLSEFQSDAPETNKSVDPWQLDRLCRDLEALWEKRGADVRKWAKGKGPKKLAKHCGEEELRDAAVAFRAQLDSLRGLYPARLIAARRALARLLGAFEAEMASRGAVTFSDLLRGARDLLTSNPQIAAQLRAELDQLLVDEFQDTDALQCDLVRTIALEGEDRPGLFVVGDPKQSIYGWRSADLEAFEAFVDAIRASGGEVLELSVNFRSVPVVLEEVERCIEPVMRERAAVQPRFQKLVSSTANAAAPGFSGTDSEGAPWAPIEHWVSWVESEEKRTRRHNTNVGLAASIEARAFAEDVHRLREECGVDLSTVALLLRSRGDLDRYLQALRLRGVPYVVTGERSYYGRREVVDAISLLRCVLDPNDHIALVGMLRSPTVGVPDAALIPLWSRNFPQLVGQLRGGLLEPDEDAEGLDEIATALREVVDAMPEVVGLERIEGWEASVVAALRILGRLRESFETEAPDRFVERLRTEFAAEVSEAGRFPAAFRLANLERFYRDLASDLAAGADEQALVRRLRSSAARERDADEPVAIVEGAVQVMTIHGAKGLGFDHVYVAQSHKGSGGGGGPTDGVERVGDRLEFHLLGTDSLGYGAAKSRRAVREAAERVRTLYVALTRAKRRLVVMGTWPKPEDPKLPEDARSYAQLVDLRPGVPDLNEAIEAGDSRFEHGDALWRFPWFEPDVGGANTAEAARVEWPTIEEVARQSAELTEMQAEAQVRMERPLRVAASRLTHAEARHSRASAEFGTDAGEESSSANAPADRAGRDVAMRIGTAVHALLEEWDFEVAPDEELSRAGERIDAVLARVGLGGDSSAAEEAADILAGFGQSPLFERFTLLGGSVLARELPVLLPREEGDDALQGTVGAIDLVYRDASGSIVVVDYKTDRVADEADLAARSADYAAQGRVYAQAVHEGLGLAEQPRFELWFLRDGRVATPLEV